MAQQKLIARADDILGDFLDNFPSVGREQAQAVTALLRMTLLAESDVSAA